MKKKINQINRNMSIAISCYRYAPESIKAMLRIENPHNPNVPAYYGFTDEYEHEIRSTIKEQGYNWVCGKHKEVFDAIKKAIRKNQRRNKLVIYYGFKMLDNPKEFAFLEGRFIKSTASIQERIVELNEVRKVLEAHNWQLKKGTTATLGADYKVESIEQLFEAINPNEPITRYALLV